MASRPDPAIALTDAEKRDLIALIQAGKPLPEKYRFMLFEDKREVERGQVVFHDIAYRSEEHTSELQSQ